MGRRRQRRTLTVAMNGDEVGQLVRAPNGVLSFDYATNWLNQPAAIPLSLSLPLAERTYSGDVVLAFFDNLLPDNQDIRQRMQRHLGATSHQPFDLLATAGMDCVGALQLSAEVEAPTVRRVVARPTSEAEIASILRNYRRHPLGMRAEEDGFRISIAGAHEKTAFLWHEGRWQRPEGPTPTTHLFKLPIGRLEPEGIDLQHSVENEWLCLRLAAALGLDVPRAEIQAFEEIKVLVVERFDRRWSEDHSWLVRLPQEDLCQAFGLPPAWRYEGDGGPGIVQIMDLLARSVAPAEDRRAFLRACIVFWLLAAPDGHAKNFSIRLGAGGRFQLAPVYDVLSVYPILQARQIERKHVRMAMAVQGKNRHFRWGEIARRHWLTTAAACRYPEAEILDLLDDCVARIKPACDEVAADLPPGFPADVAGPIFEGLRRMGRVVGAGF